MFFRKKKDNLIGLDLGSRTVKLAEVNIRKNKYTLKKFAMKDIPKDTIQDGYIQDHIALSNTIRELLEENSIKEQNVALSVSGYSVIVKTISLKKMAKEELNMKINYEAEQYIPFDINDVNLDFQITDENEDDMNIILVAAKKDMINGYINLLASCDLVAAVIDVDCFALQNIYEIAYGIDEITAVVDIGANKTNLNVIQKDKSLFMRDIAIGGESFTQDISMSTDLSFEDAERVKTGKSDQDIDIADIKNTTVIYWSSEIRRAIELYYSSTNNSNIQKILLSGGSSFVDGLIESLMNETNIPVEHFVPFNNFSLDEKNINKEYITKIAPQATICMGLAIRRVGDK